MQDERRESPSVALFIDHKLCIHGMYFQHAMRLKNGAKDTYHQR